MLAEKLKERAAKARERERERVKAEFDFIMRKNMRRLVGSMKDYM